MHLVTLHVNLIKIIKLIEILFLNFVFLLIHIYIYLYIYILHIILLVLSYTIYIKRAKENIVNKKTIEKQNEK